MKTPMKDLVVIRTAKLLYALITAAMFCVCWQMYYMPCLGLQAVWAYGVAAGVLYIILFSMLGRIYEVFTVGVYRVSQLVYSQSLSLLMAAGIAYVVMTICVLRFVNPLPLLALLAAQVLWSMVWSVLSNRLYFRLYKPQQTVVVYNNEEDLLKLHEIEQFGGRFQVTKYVRTPESMSALVDQIQDAEVVFLSDLNTDKRNAIIKYCIKNDMQCYVQPKVGDVLMAGARHMQMFSVPLMRLRKVYLAPEYLLVKRALDIVASVVAIIVASPFMLATALAIKLYDGGPVLYKQVRLTKGHKEFRLLKFRSMRTDAEKDGIARLATENDDRITPVGKVIRKIRFDELPQLFNILKGDMTIVGPRPERPEIARQYEEEIPSFGLRLQVKAGLTGYAQIYGKYNTEPYEKLKMDLMYINNMSFAEDLRLIFATIKILFIPESTEGVAEGQTTASRKETEKESQKV